jgi:hypothetical protein
MAERTVSVKLKAEVGQYMSKIRAAGNETEKFGRSAERAAARANAQWELLTTAVAAGAPAAAAAGVAAAIGGVSAGFVGLAAVALRENKRIKDAFTNLSTEVQGGLATDASVLEDEFVGAADRIGDAFQQLRPELRDAFSAAQPLVGHLTEGVIDFAENAMPSMVRSVQRAEPVFEGLRSLMADAGTGVGEFFDTISEHSEEAGQGMEHLGSLIQGVLTEVGPIVGSLTDLWAEHGDEVASVVTRVVGVLGGLSGSALPVLSTAVGGALDVLGSVLDVIEPMEGILGPAIGAWLSLAVAMKGLRGVQNLVSGVATSVSLLGESAEKSARKTKALRVGLAGLALAGGSVFAQMTDLNPQVDALAVSMERWARTGDVGGEAARLLGGDMEELEYALQALTSNGFDQAAAAAIEFGPGLIGIQGPLSQAKERVSALDQALAGMVKAGNARQAEEIIQAMAERTGVSIDEVTSLLPGYSGAVEVAASGTRNFGQSAEDVATQLAAMIDKVGEANATFFESRDAARAYEEALDTANTTIAENGATLDISTAKGRENEAALDGIAQSAIAAAVATLQDAQANGTLSSVLPGVMSNLKQQRQDFVNAAVAAGMEEGKARDLANRLIQIPDNVSTQIKLNGLSVAQRWLNTWKTDLNSIPRYLGTTVHTQYTSSGRRIRPQYRDGGLVRAYADGGQVQGFPIGGMVRGPGGPRDDLVPAMLSDGEFVVNAAATQEFLPLLKAINANRYADGGLVGATRMAAGGRVGLSPVMSTDAYVRLGDVTDDEWRALLNAGWQGRAGDEMEALYPPLRLLRDGYVRLDEVTQGEWQALLSAGWQGKAGDKMEALYPPMDRLRSAMEGAVSTVRPLSDKARAAQEIARHIEAGGRVFEDFSFAGASALVRRFNDEFAAAYRGGSMLQFLRGFHTGGAVYGTGPALLHDDEHVWTSREVQGAGGHAAVEAMRSAARSGVTRDAVIGSPTFTSGVTVIDNREFHFPNYVGSRRELVQTMREEVRVRGGDVNKVLGR